MSRSDVPDRPDPADLPDAPRPGVSAEEAALVRAGLTAGRDAMVVPPPPWEEVEGMFRRQRWRRQAAGAVAASALVLAMLSTAAVLDPWSDPPAITPGGPSTTAGRTDNSPIGTRFCEVPQDDGCWRWRHRPTVAVVAAPI